jgi:hypothetical protein
VCAHLVVVFLIQFKQVAKVPLSKYHEDKDLGFQRSPRPEQSGQGVQNPLAGPCLLLLGFIGPKLDLVYDAPLEDI